MNYIIILFVLFTLTNIYAQSDKRNYDYLNETFTIDFKGFYGSNVDIVKYY